MIRGEIKPDLSREEILKRISSYDIFRMYMGNNWRVNRPTYSPFRNEENPSFLVGNKNGFLYFIDFSDTSLRGDCFDFVGKLFNIPNYNNVLLKIDKDFSLGLSSGSTENYKKITSQYRQPINIDHQYVILTVGTRKFNHEELDYWNQYYQDIEDLKKNNVYAIKTILMNRKKIPMKENELRFGYFYGGQWKIYTPFATEKKRKWWPNNVPIVTMEGKENIKGESAFINKSKKDHMVMSKLISFSCAVQNEGIGCFSEENVKFLKENSNRQILSFDADEVGVKNSQKITKIFDFDYCNVPRKYLIEGCKDWAEFGRQKGLPAIENYLKLKQII